MNLDFSTLVLNPRKNGFVISGNAADDSFGHSVSTGDVNKDGYDDILVGAYNKNLGQGAAYIVYGGEISSRSNTDLASTALNPLTFSGFFALLEAC